MAGKNPNRTKANPSSAIELTPMLRFHLRCLKLTTVQDYFAWCRVQGVSATLKKTEIGLRRELEEAQRRSGAAALVRSRSTRDPARYLGRLCRGEHVPIESGPGPLAALRASIERVPQGGGQREALGDLIEVVGRRTSFLAEECRVGGESSSYMNALITMSARHATWLRPLRAFRPRTHNRERQFSALARHLFANYEVPAFMDSAWFRTDAASERWRDWFVHLGMGHNLRTADAPVPITRRIAHAFCHAPDDLSIEGAIRWAEMRSLGGGPRLARALVATQVGRSLDHDAFWRTVMSFFIRQPMLSPGVVGPIVDYLQNQKYEALEVLHRDGSLETRPAPRPHLAMRGRSLEALQHEMDDWHRELGRMAVGASAWRPSTIRPLRETSGSTAKGGWKMWVIEELNTKQALADEGRRMKHCVLSYASACHRGHCSIWTVIRHGQDSSRHVLTIEVSRHGSIRQCRGRGNTAPSEQLRALIRRWATRERLGLGAGW